MSTPKVRRGIPFAPLGDTSAQNIKYGVYGGRVGPQQAREDGRDRRSVGQCSYAIEHAAASARAVIYALFSST